MRRWELIEKGEPGTNLELVDGRTPSRGRGRCSSTSRPSGSRSPTCCSAAGSTRCRRRPGTRRAARRPGVSPRSARASRGSPSATASSIMGGGLAEKVVAQAGSAFKVPDGVSARVGRRAPGELRDDVVRAARAHPAAAGPDDARHRRRRRHRHGGDPARQGGGRADHRRRRRRREGRAGPRARVPTSSSTTRRTPSGSTR